MGRRVTQLATPMASADQVVAVERSDAAERNFEKTNPHAQNRTQTERGRERVGRERESHRVTETDRQTDGE